ncbi:MAG: hypothetical protein JXA60_07845 [Candidatus Coatesbacteria bacterium]|nr:hypothetical protein [Candidatus Coatesbacteria bacterium]
MSFLKKLQIIVLDISKLANNTFRFSGFQPIRGKFIQPSKNDKPWEFTEFQHNAQYILKPFSIVYVVGYFPKYKEPFIENFMVESSRNFYHIGNLKRNQCSDFLEMISRRDIQNIYGEKVIQNKYYLEGTVRRSLGMLRVKQVNSFIYCRNQKKQKDEYRLSFMDNTNEEYNSIQIIDLNLRTYCNYLHYKCRESYEKISGNLLDFLQKKKIYLQLCLSNPVVNTENEHGRMFLQVSGIYTFPNYLKGKTFIDFSGIRTFVKNHDDFKQNNHDL